MRETTTVERLKAMMCRAVVEAGPKPLLHNHPLAALGHYADLGSRYWRWPDANEFGAGLQSVGKEPPSPPIIR